MTALALDRTPTPYNLGPLDAVIRFRFTDPNPLVPGSTYGDSIMEYLPYLICVLIRQQLGLDESRWNARVRMGATLRVTGAGEHWVPFATRDQSLAPNRTGPLPPGGCADCHGTGYDTDGDGTVSGVRGAVVVCTCAGVDL